VGRLSRAARRAAPLGFGYPESASLLPGKEINPAYLGVDFFLRQWYKASRFI
jgi:hypothetical protein